jgi:hypothetical protein
LIRVEDRDLAIARVDQALRLEAAKQPAGRVARKPHGAGQFFLRAMERLRHLDRKTAMTIAAQAQKQVRKPTRMARDQQVGMGARCHSEGIAIGQRQRLPVAPDGRYMSVHFIDNDHYDLGAYNTPGPHQLPKGAGHVAAILRVQVFNPNDAAEIARLNAWQDGVQVAANGSAPFVPGSWDAPSLDAVRNSLEVPCRRFQNFEKAMMPRGQADAEQRLCAAAAGWGLLPAAQATYFSYPGEHPITECRRATYQVPRNGAFWSIQVYDKTGFIASENSTLNSASARMNPDGTFTAYFGSKALCGDVANRLDVSEGWNFMMRVYKPDPETVLGGRYTLPPTVPVTVTAR